MTSRDFHNMLSYLRNRPSEAQRLRDLLFTELSTTGENRSTVNKSPRRQWLSVREAAMQIGRSTSWLHKRLGELPSQAVAEQTRGSRKMYYIDYAMVSELLQQMKVE